MRFSPFSLLLRPLSWLPFSISRPVGRFIGRLVWWRQGETARITLTKIRLCFPEVSAADQSRLACQSIEQTASMALETPAVWYHDNEWRANQVVRWDREDLFERELDSGQGLAVLFPHLGNWEMAGMLVSARRPTTILYRPPRLRQLDGLLRELRNVGTANLVPANRKGVSAVLNTLQSGGMTMVLPDQEPATRGGIFSPFFGIPAYSMTLIHRLHQKTGARILLACARPEKNGFVMTFREPDPDIYSDSEQKSVDAMNTSIEKIVRESPELYQWEYKRFRKQPEGEVKRYRKT